LMFFFCMITYNDIHEAQKNPWFFGISFSVQVSDFFKSLLWKSHKRFGGIE